MLTERSDASHHRAAIFDRTDRDRARCDAHTFKERYIRNNMLVTTIMITRAMHAIAIDRDARNCGRSRVAASADSPTPPSNSQLPSRARVEL